METAEESNAVSAHPSANQTVMEVRWQIPQNRFIPMRMARRHPNGNTPNHLLTATTSSAVAVHSDQGFRENYRGDTSRFRNRSEDIPDNQNTSLWLTGLPADITYRELFDHLAQRGRVFSVFINEPVNVRHHTFAAATITFFDAASAQSLHDLSNSGPGFVIRSHQIRVFHNRRKTSEAQTRPNMITIHGQPSRVVTITGPRTILHLPSLFNYFEQRFYFHIDRIEVVVRGSIFDMYEIRFASFYCQAEMAIMSISRDPWFEETGVQIRYSHDPGEPPTSPQQISVVWQPMAWAPAYNPAADQATADRWEMARLAWIAQEERETAGL